MPTPSGSLALNSSFPDGLNSEKYDSPPQLTNRSPFLVVCALPVAPAVRPSRWFTDLISVAVPVARSRRIVTARLEEYRVDCLDIYAGAPETGSERNRASVAQKVQTLFTDDLDGSAAEGTVRFGRDGTEYEIDLNARHTQELRDALARYVGAARRAGAAARRPGGGARRGPASGLNTTEVREWAKAQGIEVKDRGRVPADLVARFKEATGQ